MGSNAFAEAQVGATGRSGGLWRDVRASARKRLDGKHKPLPAIALRCDARWVRPRELDGSERNLAGEGEPGDLEGVEPSGTGRRLVG